MLRKTRYLFPAAATLIAGLAALLTVTQATNMRQYERIHSIVFRDTQIKTAESLNALRNIREYINEAQQVSDTIKSNGLHTRYEEWNHKLKLLSEDLASRQSLNVKSGNTAETDAIATTLSVMRAADTRLQKVVANAHANIRAMHEPINTDIDTAINALRSLQRTINSRDRHDAQTAMATIDLHTQMSFWYFFSIALSSIGLFIVIWKQNAAMRLIAGKALLAEQRNALFAAAIESAPIGMVISDAALPDNPIIFVNKAFTEITGFTRNEAIGHNCRILQGIHTDKETAQMVRAKVKAGKTVHTEILNYRKDGTQFWNELRISPVFNKFGNITNYIAMQSDITILRANQESFTRAKEQAEHAARVKSNFMAMISHEIRTPIYGILGTLSLLQDTKLSSEQTALVDTTLSSGKTLMTLINDILDFSKIEAGKLTLETTSFDLIELVTATSELMQSITKTKSLTLTVIIDPSMPRYVTGDPTRTQQILFNLISNAVKFTNIGSVTVTITGLLHSETENGKKCIARFEITDTGIGISHEEQRHLFTEFNQLDASTTRRYGGTGLGLAISKRLVTLMGGEIGVESRFGIGSKFWFVLPLLVADTSSALANSTPTPVAHRRRGKILVVEDNPTNQMLLTAMLRKDGHQVVVAPDGLAGLTAVQTDTFDLVYMDVSMPVMDGLTATQQVRALGGSHAMLPIVAMTALVMPGDREKCLAAGMNGFISKPVDYNFLSQETWKWLATSKRTDDMPPRHDVTVPRQQSTSPLAVCDMQILHEIANGVGKDVVSNMIDIFTSDLQHRQQTLCAAVTNGDLLTVANESHALKSSSLSCGLTQFADLMKDIEFTAKTGERERVMVLAAQIDPAVKAAQAALHQAQLGFAGD